MLPLTWVCASHLTGATGTSQGLTTMAPNGGATRARRVRRRAPPRRRPLSETEAPAGCATSDEPTRHESLGDVRNMFRGQHHDRDREQRRVSPGNEGARSRADEYSDQAGGARTLGSQPPNHGWNDDDEVGQAFETRDRYGIPLGNLGTWFQGRSQEHPELRPVGVIAVAAIAARMGRPADRMAYGSPVAAIRTTRRGWPRVRKPRSQAGRCRQ